MRLTGLTCPDGFVSPQYVAEAVDTTGMVFEAEYSDGTTASVSPQSLSPSTWGNTAGTQTCTFTYTENEVSASCEVEATVEERQPAGFVVSGTMPTQYVNRNVDTTGLSYTYDGEALDPSDVTVSPASWTASGNAQTVTFTYDENTATKEADVARTVANLPVTHTSSIPVDTVRSADLDEIFENVVGADIDPQGAGGTSDWKFVIDVQGGTFAPASLDAGDCVLWVQDKSAFDLDQANNCDATYVGTSMQLYGIDGMNLSYGPGPNMAAEFSDFTINMPMTGTYQAAADAEVCWVFAKVNSNVADATTLKPSDVDLIAVWDVTYTVPEPLTVTSLDVRGTCIGTNQIGGSEDFSGLSFVFGFSDGTSATKSLSDYSVSWSSDWLEEGESNEWILYDSSLTAQVVFTPNVYYWESQGYAVASGVSDTRAIGLKFSTQPDSVTVTGTPATQYVGEVIDLTGLTVTATYGADSYDVTDNPILGSRDYVWKFSDGFMNSSGQSIPQPTVQALKALTFDGISSADVDFGQIETSANFSLYAWEEANESGSQNIRDTVTIAANQPICESLDTWRGQLTSSHGLNLRVYYGAGHADNPYGSSYRVVPIKYDKWVLSDLMSNEYFNHQLITASPNIWDTEDPGYYAPASGSVDVVFTYTDFYDVEYGQEPNPATTTFTLHCNVQ